MEAFVSFYSKSEVREKKLPINHNVILLALTYSPEWSFIKSIRYGSQVWRNNDDELLLPVDEGLADYYSLCFEAGIKLGLIESVWAYKEPTPD